MRRLHDVVACAARLHVRHINALAGSIELPAVIDTAQTAFFIASEVEVGPPMGAARLDKPDPSIRLPEQQEILAHVADTFRPFVDLCDFLRQRNGLPEPPEQIAHRRARAGACQKLIVLA